MSWLTGFNYPGGIVSDGTYMYVSNAGGNSIDKITLSTNAIQREWATGLNGPYGLAILGSYLYAQCDGNHAIAKVSLADGSLVNGSLVSMGGLGLSADVANDRLLACTVDGRQLFSVSPSGTSTLLASDLAARPYGSVLVGNNFYVVCQSGYISKVNMNTLEVTSTFVSTGLSSPVALATDGTYLYAADSTTVAKIAISDGTIVNGSFATGFSNVFASFALNSNLYLAEQGTQSVKKISIAPPPIPNTPVYLGNATVNASGHFDLAGTIMKTNRFPADPHELVPRAYVDTYISSVMSYYDSILEPNSQVTSLLDRVSYLEAQLDRVYKALWDQSRNVSAIVTPHHGSIAADYTAAEAPNPALIDDAPVAPVTLADFA